MARDTLARLTHFAVTPRFEVFYALKALTQPGDSTREWSEQVRRSIPKKLNAAISRVAPQPTMWPLLADSLRDAKADLAFDDIVDGIRRLDDEAFQRAILGGVFRGEGIVEGLVAGRQSLRAAVDAESKTNNALLTLLGLAPFHRSSAIADVFNRIVSNPAGYRADVSRTLEVFWVSAFNEAWKSIEPRMQSHVAAMREKLTGSSLAEFARGQRFPVTFDDENEMVNSLRGAALFPYRKVRSINVLPSAFNDARFWGAYAAPDGSVSLYFPVFNSDFLETAAVPGAAAAAESFTSDPALGFRALGDTTRYAIASILARTPKTSVELSKEFNVSKATISHHVQLLRAAGLLTERGTDHGVTLALDRSALEALSRAAANEMFSGGNAPLVKRSRREPGTQKQ